MKTVVEIVVDNEKLMKHRSQVKIQNMKKRASQVIIERKDLVVLGIEE